MARCAVREPKVPGTKPHNTRLLDRSQRISHSTKEQRSRDRRDLAKVTQEGEESCPQMPKLPQPADLSDDLQLENPAPDCKTGRAVERRKPRTHQEHSPRDWHSDFHCSPQLLWLKHLPGLRC